MPPTLPEVPIPDKLSPSITRPDTPEPRVVPVVQPPRVKPSQPAPTAPLRVQHAPSPTIDTSIKLCTKVVYTNKNTTPTIPTEPKLALPHQVQHHIRHTPLNASTNFRAQAAQHLVA